MNELILVSVIVRIPWGEARPAVVSNVRIRTEVVMSTYSITRSTTVSRVVEGVFVQCERT